jgi:plastocyanin
VGIRALSNVAASLSIAVVVVALPVTSAGANSVPHSVQIVANDCPSSAFCFVPSALTVADGDRVTWTDVSGYIHRVTRCTPDACDGIDGGTGTDASFTGGDVYAAGGYVPNPGKTYSHVFHGAGTYNYYCSNHGYGVMHGTVTVRAAAPTTTLHPTTTIASPATAPPATAPASIAPASIAPATIAPRVGAPTTRTGTLLARTGMQLPLLLAAVALIGLGGLGIVAAGRSRRRPVTAASRAGTERSRRRRRRSSAR